MPGGGALNVRLPYCPPVTAGKLWQHLKTHSHPAAATHPPPTWKGGSHARFCMTGRAKQEGACTKSKVTATATRCSWGSGALMSRLPAKAAVTGLLGTRA